MEQIHADDFLRAYFWSWSGVMMVALCVATAKSRELHSTYCGYTRFLTRPWRVGTFVVAWLFLAKAGDYAMDPTWDYVTSSFMAILTFTTAPWSIGVLVRIWTHGNRRPHAVFIAICAWLFSASWSYDGYLYIRDGVYPLTWWSNLFASSLLYFMAGLMWNLTYSRAAGVQFAFARSNWFDVDEEAFGRIVWIALPFALLFAAIIFGFLL